MGRGMSKQWKKLIIATLPWKNFLNQLVFQCKPKLHIQFEHQLIKEASSLSNKMQKRLAILLSSYSITIYVLLTLLFIFYFKIWSPI